VKEYAAFTMLAASANGIARFGITADMLDRQIEAESSGNPWAIGPVTRYGQAL